VPLDGSPFAEQALPQALGIVRRVLKPGEVKGLGDSAASRQWMCEVTKRTIGGLPRESPSCEAHRGRFGPRIYEEASVKTGARRSRDFPEVHSAPYAVAERDGGVCAFCSASLSVTLLLG
jgi:hypothetical protein